MQSAQQIIQAMEAAGFRARFLPMSAMEQVRAFYDTTLTRGPDTPWLRGSIDHFRSHQPPELDFEPRSILVAALPCAGATLVLQRRGKHIPIAIPPAYINVSMQQRRFGGVLADAAQGCQLAQAKGVSQKLLAALSGVGQYGRNNICYVSDWGTYSCLETRYTDIPYEGPVQTQLRMEACENCELCREACPTGAIGDRQVIDVTRCLTFQNESRKRMPRWVPGNAHHTITGCLRCQECCPQNPPVDYSQTLGLNEAETRRLLSRKKRLPGDLEEKFLQFGCEKWTMGVYKRNARLAVKAMRE